MVLPLLIVLYLDDTKTSLGLSSLLSSGEWLHESNAAGISALVNEPRLTFASSFNSFFWGQH